MSAILIRLDDDTRARLDVLSQKSGKSRNKVIRSLILGRALGDKTSKQTLARLSQLGGLLRHCAAVLKDRGEGIESFIQIGTEIREIALQLSTRETSNADNHLQAH